MPADAALQLQLPGLPDEVDAEAVMLLFRDTTEAGAVVDVACRDQDALRPQRDRLVAALAREADALFGQRAPDAEPAGFLLHEQQSQFRDPVLALDQKDRAGRFAVHFGDPAMLARGIIGFDELRGDLRDQRL